MGAGPYSALNLPRRRGGEGGALLLHDAPVRHRRRAEALLGAGRRLVVVDPSEVEDDLVRDMTEVLTSLCARLYGRRSARTRAHRALRCAEQPVEAS